MTGSPIQFTTDAAVRAVRDYNSGTYRGQTNIHIDRLAYDRFRGGVPNDIPELTDLVRFVGEDYGGAQRRFLPHGYREEAAIIVENLRPTLGQWRAALVASSRLDHEIPSIAVLETLIRPFTGTKRWPVWASKSIHFFRPDAFPILDSRAKKALGLTNLGSTPRDYHRFCLAFLESMTLNHDALSKAREADCGESASDLKLFDKILYQLGA